MGALWSVCGCIVECVWVHCGVSVGALWSVCGCIVECVWVHCGVSVGALLVSRDLILLLLTSAMVHVYRVPAQLHHCLGHLLCEGNTSQEAGSQSSETEVAKSKVQLSISHTHTRQHTLTTHVSHTHHAYLMLRPTVLWEILRYLFCIVHLISQVKGECVTRCDVLGGRNTQEIAPVLHT